MSPTAPEPITGGEWMSRSAQDTFDFGVRVGERLTGGEILLLEGALGAGKTVFVKGIAAALGINADDVTSPTFTLVNHYSEGRLTLYHLDLYRLDPGVGAAHDVGLDELLSDECAVLVIEWAERMGGYRLPAPVWHIYIEGDGEDSRRIRVARA